MDMTIVQQVALDEALVPHASRISIGKSNFQLRSDITSKESTLQVVYDVLRLTPFYKAFLVTTDIPEIYMQEFWATATVHHHSIHFKMNNKKRIVNLEYFREMLHICPTIPNQTFNELPFEEEILTFLRYLRHSGEIKTITDVNINKLHQPWRSFVTVINKFLRATPPKTKASVRKTQSSSDTKIPPPTVAGTRLSTSAKGKQPAKSSKAKDEGTGIIPGVPDVPADESDEEISWKSKDKNNDDDVDDQSDVTDDDDDQEDKDDHGMNVGGDEASDAKNDDEELYKDVNINLEGAADDQPIVEASQHPESFQKQTKPPTPDRAWNKTFMMNRLKVDTLILKLLAGPTYELMKGSCKNLVEIEFFLEEVYKATTDQLDWNNPEGQQYPHNLLKPLPLIPNS
nr:hypothetical protein [Tanacetum cinerariifolium]